MIQLTLTLKMTTAQVVETSVNNNSPIQDYVHPDDQTQRFEMTPGFKPFTMVRLVPTENNVIPMVLLVDMHLIKGT